MKTNQRNEIENALFMMTLVGLTDNIPDRDTPEMQKFADCLDACLLAGYKGCCVEDFYKGDDNYIFVYQFDKRTAFGRLMQKTWEDAKNGIMPQDPSKIMSMLGAYDD
jgi:hypothetical protein